VKALIVGVGRVGSAVAGRLRDEGWEVVVIDESEEALGRLGPNWPGEFHLGHGMDTSVLERAGIADADAFVASTDGDNTNIVIAQVAKQRYEVPAVAARIGRSGRLALEGLGTHFANIEDTTDRLITLMKRKARDRTGSEDNWKDLLKPLPFGRGATAEEIGAAIAFIASDHSGYTSGSVVTIDAGLSARAQAF